MQALAASSENAICAIKPVGKFHISQYSLEVDEINRTSVDKDGNTETINLIETNSPLISSSDDYLEAFFSLIGSEFDRLNPIDGEQQLILALGEEEIAITLGADQQVRFDNLEHLALLSPEDFLTMRLYANNDSANVLWEYAFASLFAAVDNNRDGTVTVLNSTSSGADSTEKDKNPDRTSEINPFRFWVNNDYDMVNNRGTIEKRQVRCPAFTGNQVCEQGDEDPAEGSNTGTIEISRIETERDLEDFFPLYINSQLDKGSDGYPKLPEGVTFSMRAKNININLFRGVWKEGTDYLTDTTTMQKQVEGAADLDGDGILENMHAFYLGDNISYLDAKPERIFQQRELNELFGRSSDARFIVESYKASPELCIDSPEECYLELSYKKGQQVLASAKIYMSFFDVRNYYDHYTVGEGLLGNLLSTPKKVNEEAGFEYLSLFPESDEVAQEQKDDYIMFVHGWRMQYPERVAFGETAFKRLFWSGYKGRFGLYSWPTGWFEKPAHVYGTDQISYASGNAQNYGQSETLAREAGSLLSNLFAELNQEKAIHVMAHSMGNVVVSEALRNANSQIVEHYVASQAAEVASSYYPLQAFMNHKDPIFDIDLGNAEAAWRFYNTDSDGFIDTAYDMPPNHYTYTAIPVLHGPTTPPHEQATALAEDWGKPYYSTIGNAAGTIINFHNRQDAALHGWEANQLTKPDTSDGPEWKYNYNFASSCEGLPCIDLPEVEDNDQVSDRYRRDDNVLTWRNERPLSRESATILAHIIPARTNALGQRSVIDIGNSVIDSAFDLREEFGYEEQNQDHSAQFYHSYLSRKSYWVELLKQYRLLNIGDGEI